MACKVRVIQIDVGYFNPAPVHVARAQDLRDGDILKLIVELRDGNYPGQTYTLTYDAARARFEIIYDQAA